MILRGKRIILSCSLVLFLTSTAWTFWGNQSQGTTGANFLKIGVGARAVGMGGAFVGVADDATSTFWNPAGLCQLSQQEIVFMHNEWLQDVKYEYLGYALPWGSKSTFGLSLIYLHMNPIPGYDRDGNSTSNFTVYDSAILFSLSQRLNPDASLGLGVKWINQRLEQENSHSLALDIGCLWKSNNFSVGLALSNIGTSVEFAEEEAILPSRISLGFGYRTLDGQLVFAGEVDFPNDTKPIIKQGVEYCYQNSVFLRSGCEYRTDQWAEKKTEFDLGGGFKILNYDLNYTYSPDWGVGSAHRISISYKFGSKR